MFELPDPSRIGSPGATTFFVPFLGTFNYGRDTLTMTGKGCNVQMTKRLHQAMQQLATDYLADDLRHAQRVA